MLLVRFELVGETPNCRAHPPRSRAHGAGTIKVPIRRGYRKLTQPPKSCLTSLTAVLLYQLGKSRRGLALALTLLFSSFSSHPAFSESGRLRNSLVVISFRRPQKEYDTKGLINPLESQLLQTAAS